MQETNPQSSSVFTEGYIGQNTSVTDDFSGAAFLFLRNFNEQKPITSPYINFDESNDFLDLIITSISESHNQNAIINIPLSDTVYSFSTGPYPVVISVTGYVQRSESSDKLVSILDNYINRYRGKVLAAGKEELYLVYKLTRTKIFITSFMASIAQDNQNISQISFQAIASNYVVGNKFSYKFAQEEKPTKLSEISDTTQSTTEQETGAYNPNIPEGEVVGPNISEGEVVGSNIPEGEVVGPKQPEKTGSQTKTNTAHILTPEEYEQMVKDAENGPKTEQVATKDYPQYDTWYKYPSGTETSPKVETATDIIHKDSVAKSQPVEEKPKKDPGYLVKEESKKPQEKVTVGTAITDKGKDYKVTKYASNGTIVPTNPDEVVYYKNIKLNVDLREQYGAIQYPTVRHEVKMYHDLYDCYKKEYIELGMRFSDSNLKDGTIFSDNDNLIDRPMYHYGLNVIDRYVHEEIQKRKYAAASKGNS